LAKVRSAALLYCSYVVLSCTPLQIDPEIREPQERMAKLKVMPFGDSTTARTNAYRYPLWRLLVGSQFDFVGSQSNGGESFPDNDHEGHSGFTLAQLDSNVASYLALNDPDLILIHAGINDIVTGITGAVAATRLDSLLNSIYAADPTVRVIVAKIAPFKFGDIYDSQSHRDELAAYNNAIPGVVRNHTAIGRRVSWVDCYTDYNTTLWFDDEIHPNATGNDFIGLQFFLEMATTTLATIQDKMVTDISALTPWNRSTDKFNRSPSRYPLRDWALSVGSRAFRAYEIRRTGGTSDDDPGVAHPNFVERVEGLTITIAYPSPMKEPGLYRQGATPDDLFDVEEFMRRDAQAIRNAVRDADNYVLPAHIETKCEIDPPDIGDDVVWFQTLTCSVRYHEASTAP
jgi:lysophospholipase L1-like esterase